MTKRDNRTSLVDLPKRQKRLSLSLWSNEWKDRLQVDDGLKCQFAFGLILFKVGPILFVQEDL